MHGEIVICSPKDYKWSVRLDKYTNILFATHAFYIN